MRCSGSDHSRAEWPAADAVIGNPPFLGSKLLRTKLTSERVDRLYVAYQGAVPAEADLVAYWFAKAWEGIKAGRYRRAGLVATNSIRGGASRRVLDRIAQEGTIFDAWDDEPWVVDGTAVRVSLICFGRAAPADGVMLDGRPVQRINPDLTETLDLTIAKKLRENAGFAFMGDTKGGAFDVPAELARQWLELPLNPNGRPNSDVLRPWMNGMDVTRQPSGRWIIDFGAAMSEREAALYEAPFAYVRANVQPARLENRRDAYREFWWRHVEPRPGMWRALRGLDRFIVTPEVSKHRIFAWLRPPIVPDHKLQVIASDNDAIFGILVSRLHKAWSLRLGSWHGVGNDPRYTIGTTFETFPFPENVPLTINGGSNPAATKIAAAARRLDELREKWLHPPDLVKHVPEVAAGFPDRMVPISAKAAVELKKRTLTNLYNEKHTWLLDAHRDIDEAVASAYGWPISISDDDAVGRLFELNLARAEASGATVH
jgi:type II restriction/modification system DNA methylase subunit YeeA